MLSTDDKNSICSDTEELEVNDKDEEEEVNDDDDNEEEDDDDDDDDEEEEDDDEEEFDPTIIQFELLKNFLVDDEGNNVATNLGVIAHELRRLNKILSKK